MSTCCRLNYLEKGWDLLGVIWHSRLLRPLILVITDIPLIFTNNNLLYKIQFLTRICFPTAEWWNLYATEAPNLRQVAVKVLSQTSSAGGCERNWSTFNLIHSKRRNKLGIDKLNDLVYIHYNTRLRMRHIQEGFDFKNKEMTDPIDLAYIFRTGDNVLESWINDIGGDPVMDVRGRPDPELSKKMGADVEGHMKRSGHHTFPIRALDGE
jgi:hypothetical protein